MLDLLLKSVHRVRTRYAAIGCAPMRGVCPGRSARRAPCRSPVAARGRRLPRGGMVGCCGRILVVMSLSLRRSAAVSVRVVPCGRRAA
nr:hypothetical protein RVX_0247 [Nitratidesulfovibrio sp. HK-II]